MEKIVTGFHFIEEKVKSGKNQSNLKVLYSKIGPRVKKIIEIAEKNGIKCIKSEDDELNSLVKNLDKSLQDHRGIVLKIENVSAQESNIVDFDTWLKENKTNEKLTVVILDKVTDPHNVGAILRSCDQFGVSLVIIPEHKSASDITSNEVIGRTSAGASSWVKVSLVNNLVRCTEQLKEAGFWIYGADAGGQTLGTIDFPQKTCLIMGSEGSGISQLLEKQCDSIVSIPTCGKIDSLNVSVAAGVLLYELYRRQK